MAGLPSISGAQVRDGGWTTVARRKRGPPPSAPPPSPALAPPAAAWKFKPGAQPVDWKAACFGLSPSSDERKLQFFPPSKVGDRRVAVVEQEIVHNCEERWANTLVGYILGGRPYYQHLKAFTTRMWKPASSLDIFSRNNGIFLFKFGSGADCDRILESGPWFFDGRLIVLKRWSRHAGSERDLLTSVPIWIRLPGLRLEVWNPIAIGKIASLVGNPLTMDTPTTKIDRVDYARCLVEVTASSKLPKSVEVHIENEGSFDQQVDYEWVPPTCSKCCSFGHTTNSCPTTPTWKEKEVSTTEAAAEINIEPGEASILCEQQVLPDLELADRVAPNPKLREGSLPEETEPEPAIDPPMEPATTASNQEDTAEDYGLHGTTTIPPKESLAPPLTETSETVPHNTGKETDPPPARERQGLKKGFLNPSPGTSSSLSKSAPSKIQILDPDKFFLLKRADDSEGDDDQSAPSSDYSSDDAKLPSTIAVPNPAWEDAVLELRTKKGDKAISTKKKVQIANEHMRRSSRPKIRNSRLSDAMW